MTMRKTPEPDPPEWWLDDSALPDLIWARLSLGQDGPTVRDCDGALHLFDNVDAAVLWLRRDEYRALRELREDGSAPPALSPPSAADGHAFFRPRDE